MPFPLPSRTPSGPRRRSLLASAAGAALLVGCSSAGENGADTAGAASGSPSVTERARTRAAQDSDALLRRYDAVLAVHPALARRLGPLRAEVAAHVEAFGGVGNGSGKTSAPPSASNSPSASASLSASPSGAPSGAPSASPSSAPSTSPVGTPAATTAPGTEKEALVGLAAAERTLADRRATTLLEVPGELARLLASVAAAGAAHAYLLTEGTR
ncbi:hypothetical protein OG562_31300 [Streptomyces sp. NBC_01275]|uniref:hypothetical protein n=1 Tax=Streptomyces sp. NBC_01275 TaxID=2903807 RepID=UPI00224CF1B0|nr:hypothetical protein [Streptomyces sp. NBC_01275]MCX4765387.1 hypothetical protein [Streptomyces sp. NBC_01275]